MGEGGGAGELAGARPSPTLQLLNSAANLLCGHISMPVMYICMYNTLIHHTPNLILFSTHSVVFQIMEWCSSMFTFIFKLDPKNKYKGIMYIHTSPFSCKQNLNSEIAASELT